MFFDTSFNSLDTVLSNLYLAFKDAALRCFYYMKSLSASSQPSFKTLKSKELPLLSWKQFQDESVDKTSFKGTENLAISLHISLHIMYLSTYLERCSTVWALSGGERIANVGSELWRSNSGP
jgi:hypothetical protein